MASIQAITPFLFEMYKYNIPTIGENIVPKSNLTKPVEELTKTPEEKQAEAYENALWRFLRETSDYDIKVMIDRAKSLANVRYNAEINHSMLPFGGKHTPLPKPIISW